MARVLIVDDNESDRLLQTRVLERAGHQLFFAREGEEAYKLFLRKQIEVVVTDLQMPNVDGLELIAEIKSLFPDVSIIAVSGAGSDGLETAELLGAFRTLAKPVEPDDLVAAVAEAATR